MSELNKSGSSSRQNPIIWVSLVVIGLIAYVFLNGDRGNSSQVIEIPEKEIPAQEVVEDETLAIVTPAVDDASGTIDRSVLLPPGMRARQYIKQLRSDGEPYPLSEVFEQAQTYMLEGSLADAHLAFFFAAREGHVPSIMKMGEMSDPTLFRAQDSLLDNADVIQSYKWY